MQGPRCVYCDKPLPKLTTTVWVGDPDTKHRQTDGNWYRHVYPEQPLRSIDDCRWLSNQQVISLSYSHDGTVRRFAEWDGKTYWNAASPCCSTACAIKFARSAHKAGYRMDKKELV